MDIGFLQEYLVLVVVGICLCMGYVLKHLIPTDKINKFIPLIMAILGTFLNVWLSDWSITPVIILGGLVSGLASTGLHQTITKLIYKSDSLSE